MTKQEEKIVKMLKSYSWKGYDQSINDAVKILIEVWDYVMDKGGHSGMSAGFTALDFYSKAMHIDDFRIVDRHDYLYPQCFEHNILPVLFLKDDLLKRIKKNAKKELAKSKRRHVHPDVLWWWKGLAKGKQPYELYEELKRKK